jgi:hypothetical protein
MSKNLKTWYSVKINAQQTAKYVSWFVENLSDTYRFDYLSSDYLKKIEKVKKKEEIVKANKSSSLILAY